MTNCRYLIKNKCIIKRYHSIDSRRRKFQTLGRGSRKSITHASSSYLIKMALAHPWKSHTTRILLHTLFAEESPQPYWEWESSCLPFGGSNYVWVDIETASLPPMSSKSSLKRASTSSRIATSSFGLKSSTLTLTMITIRTWSSNSMSGTQRDPFKSKEWLQKNSVRLRKIPLWVNWLKFQWSNAMQMITKINQSQMHFTRASTTVLISAWRMSFIKTGITRNRLG